MSTFKIDQKNVLFIEILYVLVYTNFYFSWGDARFSVLSKPYQHLLIILHARVCASFDCRIYPKVDKDFYIILFLAQTLKGL